MGGSTDRGALRNRVARTCGQVLAAREVVAAEDVLAGLGWAHPVHIARWRKGRTAPLTDLLPVPQDEIRAAMAFMEEWGTGQGLRPVGTVRLSDDHRRRELWFTVGPDPELEQRCRTRWTAPRPEPAGTATGADGDPSGEAAAPRRRSSWARGLTVVSPLTPWSCAGCGGATGADEPAFVEGTRQLCLTCVDLDHLTFLPVGEGALTLRAKRASRLCADVVRFSRARTRHERLGVLVEPDALEAAERACLGEEVAAERRRARTTDDRAGSPDQVMVAFPACPPERAAAAARLAAARAAARGGPPSPQAVEAVEAAVRSVVRHQDTSYDDLLMAGMPPSEARGRVQPDVEATLARWRPPGVPG